MAPHHRKLKILVLTIGLTDFQAQVRTGRVVNNSEDGEKMYTFGGPGEAGEFREDAEPNYALEMTLFADWRSGGLSDFLTANDGQIADFVFDHHPDIPEEHVRRTGKLKVRDPGMGGDARTTETQEVTLQIIDKPTYERVGV
jgi:hypothetical protein